MRQGQTIVNFCKNTVWIAVHIIQWQIISIFIYGQSPFKNNDQWLPTLWQSFSHFGICWSSTSYLPFYCINTNNCTCYSTQRQSAQSQLSSFLAPFLPDKSLKPFGVTKLKNGINSADLIASFVGATVKGH